MEGEDEVTGSCIDDRHLPSFTPVSPMIIYLVPRGLFRQTHKLLLTRMTPAGHKHTDQTANESLGDTRGRRLFGQRAKWRGS